MSNKKYWEYDTQAKGKITLRREDKLKANVAAENYKRPKLRCKLAMNKFRIETGRELLATSRAKFCISFSMETAKGETKQISFIS